MLSLEAVPSTVTLRAAAPAPRRSSASRSISPELGRDVRDGCLGSERSAHGLVDGKRGRSAAHGTGSRRGQQSQAHGASRARLRPQTAAAVRGAVMRSNSPVAIAPAVSSNVASVAISTIGSFFG